MTLGLSMITNKADKTIEFLDKYGKYFDKWFITVADKDKEQYLILNKLMYDKINLSYYKWNDDFAAARNFNLDQITTDYWFWADDDDDIINPERLAELVNFMQQNRMEVLQFKYDYDQ